MVKEKKKKASKPEQAPAEQTAPSTEEKQQSKETEKKPKEKGKGLITALTILLLLVGVGELGLVVFMGFGVYRGRLAQQAYEAQLAANSTSLPVGTVSYAGPWLIVENGTVTWRREDDPLDSGIIGSGVSLAGSSTDSDGSTQTEYPRTPSSPPRSWIWTIDSEPA